MVFVKVKIVGSIIVILCHLGSSTLRLNLVVFALWEDKNQGSEDVLNNRRPTQGVQQIPSSIPVQEREYIEALSQSTTSTYIRNNNSGIPLVFNTPPSV